MADGDTDSSSTPIRRKVSVSATSAPSSPQMPTQQPSRCPLSIRLDHPKHRRMVRIVEIIQLCVLPVDGQRVLGQIVSADAEEIHFLRQKVADHHRGGRLDHDALLEITVRNPGPVHLLA